MNPQTHQELKKANKREIISETHEPTNSQQFLFGKEYIWLEWDWQNMLNYIYIGTVMQTNIYSVHEPLESSSFNKGPTFEHKFKLE